MEESEGIKRGEERRGRREGKQMDTERQAAAKILRLLDMALPSHDSEASRTWWFHTETLSIL